MARAFAPATAEDVLAAVEAVSAAGRPVSPDYVAAFWGLRVPAAESALHLAVDLGFLRESGGEFDVLSPLCRLTRTAAVLHKAAVLRLLLDTYEPFTTFRERLIATGNAQTAAEQTRVALDLAAHRDEIKETLVSLGSFAQALQSEGGGRFVVADVPHELHLLAAAQACVDITSAERRIREQLATATLDVASGPHVTSVLAQGLLKAAGSDARGAVLEAGNAVESYLLEWGGRVGVNLAAAPGINSKIDALAAAGHLPGKLAYVGKYLGHVRNAADHGIDTDVGAAWTILPATGVEYVLVACSFLDACRARELALPPAI